MITWDELDVLVRSAQPILAATLYPAAALLGVVHGAELHRLGDENVHTVDDYKPTPDPAPPPDMPVRLPRPVTQTPIHDEVAALPMSDDTARRIARVWLEDIGREARAKARAEAGIRAAGAEHWASLDGTCWSDCPACARDLTGAFPVVAVTAR